MKAGPNVNGIQEINTGSKKLNNRINIINKKISTDFCEDSLAHKSNNFQNYFGPSKNEISQNNDQGNNNMNTSNTVDYNIVDPATIKELEKIVDTAPKLDLEIINTLTLPKGLLIEINALGMVSDSRRNCKDGNTFFGFLLENEGEIDNNQKIDFLIKPKEENFEQRIIGRHFRIRFDLNKENYLIKDLGCGYGTFMKIIEETELKDNYLINIGNSYIVCTFGVDEFEVDGDNILNADKILNIKVFSENNQNSFFFNPSQIKKIFIGRDTSCNIIVDDTLLSRIHCTLEYIDDKGWVIYDGKNEDSEIINSKPSTNGTWLYLIEETIIKDKMIFKSNQNVYQCHLKS